MTDKFTIMRAAILRSLPNCARVDPPLRDAADFIFVRYILGDGQKRSEIKRFLDELGVAQNPCNGALPQLHTFGMAVRALNMIGATPVVPFRFISAWSEPQVIIKWIEELDWSNPWQSSIEVLHILNPVAMLGQLKLDKVMKVLESFQSEDGGWGCHPDPHHRVAAAFHFIPIYKSLKRTPPRLDKLARVAATFQFTSSSGFLAMDTAYVLSYAMAKGAIEYDQITWVIEQIEDFIVAPDMDLGDRHSHVGVAQLLSVLAGLRGKNGYRDAWDPGLWCLPRVPCDEHTKGSIFTNKG